MDDKATKIKQSIEVNIDKNNLDEAYALAEKYVTIEPNDSYGYYLLGYLSIVKNQYEKARPILEKGLCLKENNANLNFTFANLLCKEGNSKEALKYFCRAKLFDPLIGFNMNLKSDFSKLDVVFGSMEIANQMYTSVDGLKVLGINASSVNYYPGYLGYESDYTLDLPSFNSINAADIETKKLASNLISENNVFHFYFGTALTLDYSDLPLIKELGKKIVMQYWGSDVRMYSKAVKLNKYVKVKDMNEDEIKRKLEFLSHYIPDCLVDYELAEYVRDFHANLHYIRPSIDLSKYKFIENTIKDKPLIVHAPTSPEFKGTPYILEAIEELKQSYDFNFQLVQGMSHEEAVKIYESSDLIIDQILTGSYGLFSIEAMALGKPVICLISDFMKEKYPKDLPIISANPDNLKDKLEYYLKNQDLLIDLGIKGRAYVEKYHDRNLICLDLVNVYNTL
ncbi:glycosyltransferase [Clostridium manihotivorum]|uniref:Transferase n=1 Tax=Clostridium manihotivorum TaxID=2320868 RepID=A0A410DNF2_9CLOT|nr:glycosyltransferase [Clostridium manihotivorum]QAA30590.1 transferase [Clostridium manihotivorum]